VATVTRLYGDLDVAEDAVQDACAVAISRWPGEGVPANPTAWLVGVARHKAIDRLRREHVRVSKEAAAVRELEPDPWSELGRVDDDALSLIFMCCHPALDPTVRVPLTLRAVCGLSTGEIAALYLVPEATMTKRLQRAKRKIRDNRIPFTLGPAARVERLGDVLRVVYLMFSEGHRTHQRSELVDGELCDRAIDLARTLHSLMPDEPEVVGLLALVLLTDARRRARVGLDGELVVLEEQDRSRWNQQMIDEGDHLLQTALATGRPGAFQIWAAIAACHSTCRTAADTDWRQIAGLYQELLRYEPTAVVEANRAVAVAMAEGPSAGLVILETLTANPQLDRWPSIHIARGDLYRRLNDTANALDAYRTALQLEPPPGERSFIHRRIQELERAW
jgi:RNA polymerase sigma-70 factor, ECF subfamily